jgi:DNA-binding XRE family transcriptional regulator
MKMPTAKIPTIAERQATKALSRRFRVLCDETGEKHLDVAKAIGLSPRISWALYNEQYESGLMLDVAVAIADHFHVSLESLVK